MDIREYRSRAIEGAKRAAAELGKRGVDVVVNGSLAHGTFSSGCDVDFVVLSCPRSLK